MRRSAAAVCGALALALAACGVGGERAPHAVKDDDVPFGLLQPNAPTLVPRTTAPASTPVTLCFVQEDHLAETPTPIDDPVTLPRVVAALAEPPATTAGLRTALGAPPFIVSVHVQAGVARVDLAPSVANLGGADQQLAVAQLVCTLTDRPGVGQVSFTLAGAPVDVPRGDGSLTPDPVSRDDYAVLFR